jgi:hypothetical protein
MALVTSMRLSVQPVTAEEWAIVCEMGGLDPAMFGIAAAPVARTLAKRRASDKRS